VITAMKTNSRVGIDGFTERSDSRCSDRSRELPNLLQLFLMGRVSGVARAAQDAVGPVSERSGCSIPVLAEELEDLALAI